MCLQFVSVTFYVFGSLLAISTNLAGAFAIPAKRHVMLKVLLTAILLVYCGRSARLSKDVIPSRQFLHLKFDMDRWTYKAKTTITVNVSQRRDNIWLYASSKHFKMTAISLHKKGEKIPIAHANTNKETKTLFILPRSPIERGIEYSTIIICFQFCTFNFI